MAESKQIKVTTYRGVDVFIVTYLKSVTFRATLGNQKFTGPSFESITKKLDPAIGFEPRDMATEVNGAPQIVRIVGRERPYGRDNYRFVRADGVEVRYETFYDASAEPLLARRRQLMGELDAIKEQLMAQIDKINEQLNPLIVRAED